MEKESRGNWVISIPDVLEYYFVIENDKTAILAPSRAPLVTFDLK